jgi:hypothetical protein
MSLLTAFFLGIAAACVIRLVNIHWWRFRKEVTK